MVWVAGRHRSNILTPAVPAWLREARKQAAAVKRESRSRAGGDGAACGIRTNAPSTSGETGATRRPNHGATDRSIRRFCRSPVSRWSGYRVPGGKGAAMLAFCGALAPALRRTGPAPAQVLRRITYHVEVDIRGPPSVARRAVCQKGGRPTSTELKRSCARNWALARRPNLPRQSAIRCHAGRGSPASSMTGASSYQHVDPTPIIRLD